MASIRTGAPAQEGQLDPGLLRPLQSGAASGMVSAGNSGAVLAGGLSCSGASITWTAPASSVAAHARRLRARGAVDMGANVECTPLQLVQFALMGEIYARRVLGVFAAPRRRGGQRGKKEKAQKNTTPAPTSKD